MASINEIIKPRKNSGSDGNILDEYVDSKKIAQNIFDEYIKLYVKGKGFPLDGRTSRFGIISNCMALSTIIELESLGAKISVKEQIFVDLIEYTLAEIYKNGDSPIFGASPYINDDEERNIHLDTYVETISKVLITMTDLRSYLIREDVALSVGFNFKGYRIEDKEYLIGIVEKLIISCIRALNDSCLPNGSPTDYKINGEAVNRGKVDASIDYRGWTYRDVSFDNSDSYDVSVYFTYHATNAFLSFYKTFSELFDEYFEDASFDEEKISDYKKRYSIKFDRIFFNKNIKDITEFRKRVICAGRYFETQLIKNGVNLALDYISKNLQSVTFESIINSQKSNDVINTVLVMAILVNAGLDDDYVSKGQKNYLYEQLQFCMNNVKKIYSILKKNSNEDVVNSYRLIFNEKYPKNELSTIQYFRRQCDDIAVYDFVPLFCNTYSTVSQYLIQYPQREMVDNLAMIMENRMGDKWLWSKEGYNVNNNLYYIFALENFYEYYKEYEEPLSENGRKYNSKVADAIKEKLEIKNLYDKKQIECDELVKKYEDKQSNLDKEVNSIAEKAIERCVEKAIDSYFDSVIKDAVAFAVEVVSQKKFDSTYSPGEKLYAKYPRAKIMHKLGNPEFYLDIVAGKEFNINDIESLRESVETEIVDKRFKEIGNFLKNHIGTQRS